MVKMVKINKMMIALCLAVFVFFIALFNMLTIFVSYADIAPTNLDGVSVMDDLNSSKVDGKDFNFSKYGYNPEDTNLYLMNFVEYGLSEQNTFVGDYRLYVYIYNPSAKGIRYDMGMDKITLATEYTSEGAYSNFQKFGLHFLSESEDKLYAKFKVIDRKINGKNIFDRVSSDKSSRRYDISEIEIADSVEYGNVRVTAYACSSTYKFTGFMKGYGTSEVSTMSCTVNQIQMVSLDRYKPDLFPDDLNRIKTTNLFFPTTFRARGGTTRASLNSVVFCIDEKIASQYDKLQKVHAEWYELKTAPIIVTNNQKYYDEFHKNLGIDVSDGNAPSKYNFLGDRVDDGGAVAKYNLSYNQKNGIGNLKQLDYLFFTETPNVFDYSLPKDDLEKYINAYNNTTEEIVFNGRRLKKSLFVDIPDDFQNNVDSIKKEVNLDTDNQADWFNFRSSDIQMSWMAKLFNKGYDYYAKSYSDVEPIIDLSKDILGTDAQIIEKYLIDENDVKLFRDFYNVCKGNNKRMYIFRYSVTEYISHALDMFEYSGIFPECIRGQAFLAQQSITYDFDILDFTFNKDGEHFVLPVAMTPTDIFNDVDPPIVPPTVGDGVKDWFDRLLEKLEKFFNEAKNIFLLIAVVVILLLLWKPIAFVVKLLFNIISLPFKAISSMCKRSRR